MKLIVVLTVLVSIASYLYVYPESLTKSNLKQYNPEIYHGGDKSNFFEGWYFKISSTELNKSFSVIPGVYIGDTDMDEPSMAFIMVMYDFKTYFYTYPISAFTWEKDFFHVQVGRSWFNQHGYHLDVSRYKDGGLEDERTDAEMGFSADVQFENIVEWPKSILSPGVMGWYGLLPELLMECNHGVVAMDANIQGNIKVGDKDSFSITGKGYIEKDWGRAFPSSWIWFQTNTFKNINASVFGSVAIIPWTTYKFPGYLFGFWYEGVLYRMTTYTGAVVEKINNQENTVEIIVSDNDYHLRIIAHKDKLQGDKLYAPVNGKMTKTVLESISCEFLIEFSKKIGDNRLEKIISDEGILGGLEVMGNIEELSKPFTAK